MNPGPDRDPKLDDVAPCDVLPRCPICDGYMETVYARLHQKVCQCIDCGTSLTVPASAWTVASGKRRDTPAA